MRLQAGVTAFNSGLRGNSENVRALLMFAQGSGQDSNRLAKTIKELTFGVKDNNAQADHISERMRALANTFGMSTDDLLESMKGLSKSMETQQLLGIAPQIHKAITSLSAQLGPGSGDKLTNIVNDALSEQGPRLMAMIGASSELGVLRSGEGDIQGAIFGILKKAESKTKPRAGELKGPMGAFAEAAQKQQFCSLLMAPALLQQMENGAEGLGRTLEESMADAIDPQADKIINTLDSFGSKVMDPFTNAIQMATNELYKAIGANPDKSVGVGQVVGGAAAVGVAVKAVGLLGKFKGLMGGLFSAKAATGAAGLAKGVAGRGLLAGIGSAIAGALATPVGAIAGVLTAVGATGFGIYKAIDYFGSKKDEEVSSLDKIGSEIGSTITPSNSQEFEVEKRQYRSIILMKWDELLRIQKENSLILELLNDNMGNLNNNAKAARPRPGDLNPAIAR